MTTPVLIYSTWPDAQTALAAGRTLVHERLAACMNVLGAVASVYRWQGAVEDASEVAALVKTTADRAAAATARIVELHPYETPAVLALQVDVTGTHGPFAAWIAAETRLGD
jgi:periplasmic divalent cation tolerance protein